MTDTLGDIGEKKLLQRIQPYLGKSRRIIRSFSEDCAVIDAPGEYYQLFTTDVLVEGVHFRRDFMPAYYVGRKGLKANLSDVAAMAGEPLFFLVSIGAPSDMSLQWIQELYDGMASVSKEADTLLIGGNVSDAPIFFLDITVIGRVLKRNVCMRSSAKIGDSIFVTGRLGGSAEGLKLLQDGFRCVDGGDGSVILPGHQNDSSYVRDAILSHFDPPFLLDLARQLAVIPGVHAMMDLSDGLASDIGEICRESKVGARIELLRVPLHPAVLHWERKRKSDPILLALHGGEDYHLLFTASAASKKRIRETATKSGLEFFDIGKIVDAREGLSAIDPEGRETPLGVGYEHFRLQKS
jgi:thiamine-monophosphate kinase